MSDLDYVVINVANEFPALWKEFIDQNQNSLIGSSKFNNFLKSKNINGFAKFGGPVAQAHIRHDHYMWLKLKY